MPDSENQHRRAARMASVAVAAVLALAATLTACGSGGSATKPGATSTPSQPSSSSPATSSPSQQPSSPVPSTLEGTLWLLTKVTGTHGTVDLAKDHASAISTGVDGAWLHLSRNGAFGSEDTVNFTSGRYDVTGQQLVVGSTAETLAGYAGHDAWRVTVIDAIDAIASGAAPVLFGGTTSQLVLSTDGYTLTFENHGMVADDSNPTAAPSPTTTVDSTATAQAFPPRTCPSTTAIHAITGDPHLASYGVAGTAHDFSCHYQGPGNFDSLTIFVSDGSSAYDTALQQAHGQGTVTAVPTGDRAFRVAFTEGGTHMGDNFGEQRGDVVLVMGEVGPGTSLTTDLTLSQFFLP